jgi:hypothetical protein
MNKRPEKVGYVEAFYTERVRVVIDGKSLDVREKRSGEGL